MSNLKLMFTNIKYNIRNEKELKSAFITSVIGMCINNVAFTILWYYFGKTVGVINGWEAVDIFFLYAFSAGSFGIVTALFYGLFNIPRYISSGNFDKYLLTPKNLLMKVSTSAINTSAIGDFIFGIICFFFYLYFVKLSFVQIILSLVLLIFACIIYYAFSLICMSISFYLMDGENVSHGIYGMFLSSSLYHGGAFTGVLRVIFIFVIPSLLLGAIPVETVKNINYLNVLLIGLFSIVWLIIGVTFFYKSLKKYESNNLFGFGG